MKDGGLKATDKEKENMYAKLVIHMKVNINKMVNMAMVFINITLVTDTLEIGNMEISMVMVFITLHLVI